MSGGLKFTIQGADVLTPAGIVRAPVGVRGGVFSEAGGGQSVDLTGFLVLPGIVDMHGDGFERHLAPRRGAIRDLGRGLIAAEAELAANGITTAVLAQFYSWEGGMRGPDFAARVFAAMGAVQGRVATDLRAQLRFETHMIDHYARVLALVEEHGISYLVFNDHLPHARLEAGKKPPRLTGQALKGGRSPEAHLAMLQALHARGGEVAEAVRDMAAQLQERCVALGSHDDATAGMRRDWRAMGLTIAEFPETREAAEEARAGGDAIVLGAPNVVRGGSHKGNADAADLVVAGLCDALASDYHYPSLHGAVFKLGEACGVDFATAWGLVSAGPARVLGLSDRGAISDGLRADFVVMDQETRQVCATFSAGRVSYMAGKVAAQFIG